MTATDLAATRLAATRLAATGLAKTGLAKTNLAATELAKTNLAATELAQTPAFTVYGTPNQPTLTPMAPDVMIRTIKTIPSDASCKTGHTIARLRKNSSVFGQSGRSPCCPCHARSANAPLHATRTG